ncbi:MAG: DUF445 domain-containing protein [Candidatus Cloacimonetes bacterium]|nr:DUF445 domain-containing protein [Candidatus Cloacimonadota bacterium]
MFNKSSVTNYLSILIIIVGMLIDNRLGLILLNVGLFALSGAITNWLAIHMLFEKIPLLYGSGVIPARFKDFKKGIHDLIMNQFFNKENLVRFFADESNFIISSQKFSGIIEHIDFDPIFDSLIQTILQTPMGGMLQMIGGQGVIEPLREPFKKNIKRKFMDLLQSDSFEEALKKVSSENDIAEDIITKTTFIVDSRLNELTPQMVKEIIQQMIRKHLGWLVVWGGVFGGLIGLVTAFIKF